MENEYEIFSPPTCCDACKSPRIRLTTNREIHGAKANEPDALVYACSRCKASIGVVTGTDKPMGLMCDPYLRALKFRAHLTFDPLWQFGRMSRSKAYKLLREHLNLSEEKCHIGVMTKEHLLQVITFCRNYLSAEAEVQRRREAKKYERQIKRNERRNSLETYKRGAKRFT